ncbi:MAG: PIN domain-containing protein [Candidatus Hydrogenedens sp.]|nr:PIN domain-containing protein [Candidatus Hydrogenedens sp.]
MSYLVDTNACIALLRGKNAALIRRWEAERPQAIFLCSIVVYELRYGAERSISPQAEHAKLDAFLAPYISLPFTDDCAGHCASIRHQLESSGCRIGPNDLKIAAIARANGLTLVTHNLREFGRVDGLLVVDWEL